MAAHPKSAPKILVVEDRDTLRRMLETALTRRGWEVIAVADGEAAMAELTRRSFDLVLTDLMLPGASGLEVLAAARRAQRETPVVVLTGHGSVNSAVEAMKLGAADFLEKPVELEDLFALAESLLHGDDQRTGLVEIAGAPTLVGRHPAFRAALQLLRKVAPTESTVLITGETGTGKELFARALHGLSKRADGPFVAVNCAAIPEALVENELFGHEKGAYTGAGRQQAGRFELAAGGTIFLDEIGELDPAIQGKILRVLEERTFERVGGGRPIAADVRIAAATNRDLAAMVKEGTFRQDLFFRLDVFPVALPALRDRAGDVGPLAHFLLRKIAERSGTSAPHLADDAIELLERQPWPGNVRQLANVLERAAILADGAVLRAADFEAVLTPARTATALPSENKIPSENNDERAALREALIAAGGDKRRAAEALGMSLRTLQRKARQYDLEGVEYRD